jgi:hypothetical protein
MIADEGKYQQIIGTRSGRFRMESFFPPLRGASASISITNAKQKAANIDVKN